VLVFADVIGVMKVLKSDHLTLRGKLIIQFTWPQSLSNLSKAKQRYYFTIILQLFYNYLQLFTIILQLFYNYFTIILQLFYNYFTIIYNYLQLFYNYLQLFYNYFTIIYNYFTIILQLFYNYLQLFYNYFTIILQLFTIILQLFLCAFAILRKATIYFVTSVRPSVRMEQLGSHWRDFFFMKFDVLVCLFRKSVEKIEVLI
jgi:hypothetical protein